MELIVLNIVFVLYLIVTIYYSFLNKHKMTSESYHHVWSHTYIVFFLAMSINLYMFKGWVIPLVFALLHMVQHVTKENVRLMSSNRWTKDVHDEHSEH